MKDPFIEDAADKMAMAVIDLIDIGLLDSRSRASDAMMRYCAVRTGVMGDEINAFRKMMDLKTEQ